MTLWDPIMKTRQAEFPDPLFIRFVARNYYGVPDRSRVKFLDIGCGGGANSWFAAVKGFDVTALDSSIVALQSLKDRFEREKFFRDKVRYLQTDITTYPLEENFYDCILDYNSLCHVEKPPYYTIFDALKPKGKFFSVMPAFDTWPGTLEGKGFCRKPKMPEVFDMLKMFPRVDVRKSMYPDQSNNITSWVVEASK
jgi:SAM-dependent methyltransferase